MVFPHNQSDVYLFDNCGEIVHIWEDDDDFRPGNSVYLQDNGDLIKCKRPSVVVNDPIWAGGGGATVDRWDWDGNLLWSMTINNDLERLHHDVAPMPNGNLLMIVWEKKTEAEAIQAGRNPDLITEGELWPDYIIEVEPVGSDDYNIVWEWHAWDHLVQDFDATKDNYGVVSDHPEKIDINYDTSDGAADWMHSNAIAYHPDRDQIILSVPTFHEYWIIDHSTSTAQAASSNGGLSSRGGDLMYRFGNPAAYQSGGVDDQQLFYQHDTHWAFDYLDQNNPYYGKLLLFNNRVGEDFSQVNVMDPAWEMYGWEYPAENGVWTSDFTRTFTHPEPSMMYSTGLSSVQALPNGNLFILTGRFWYALEITPDDEIVWEYKVPIFGGQPVSQGDTLLINNNITFRMTRIPTDASALDGRDLTPQGFWELNPDTDFCSQILSTVDVSRTDRLQMIPNPTDGHLTIEWDGGRETVEVFDALGRLRVRQEVAGGRAYLDLGNLKPGIYWVRLQEGAPQKLIIQ
ncbi:MAG: aryl-sulfate sulfotransferase [Bacteroidota bacterium]